MSDDLVKRLRAIPLRGGLNGMQTAHEAADALTRQQARIAELEALMDRVADDYRYAKAHDTKMTCTWIGDLRPATASEEPK